ncbi:MAG: hypothetical protein AUI10_01705 [Actinobacteria bacterium 13_2_20CM_2_72_6]|nr:MAG: hypothetical protein AUI10_01705 [Actinobacteria bacterium 13_2_20CM_2_72_6]
MDPASLLVYFGVAATLAATSGSLGVVAAYAVALTLAVWIFSASSGAHLNPAVTIAVAVRGRFAWRDVPGYLIAQVVGGVLAGLLAWVWSRVSSRDHAPLVAIRWRRHSRRG